MKNRIIILCVLLFTYALTIAQVNTFSKVYPIVSNTSNLYDVVELNDKYYTVGLLLNTADFTVRGYSIRIDKSGNKELSIVNDGGDSINPSVSFRNIFTVNSNLYVSGQLLFYDSSVSKYVLDPILIKYDTVGNELWYRKDYGFGARNFATSTDLLFHNNQILHLGSTVYEAPAGQSRTQNTVVFWMDTIGNVTKFKEYSLSTQHKYEIGADLEPLADGGFLITGQLTNNGNGGHRNGFIAKIDSLGNTLWFKSYGEQGRLEDLYSVTVLADGNYLACGWRARDEDLTGVNAAWDAWLVKVNPLNGDTIWTKTVNGAFYNAGVRTFELVNGDIMLGGEGGNLDSANGDAQLIRLDSDGNKLWVKRFGWPYNPINFAVSAENIYEFKKTGDGGYMIVGNGRDFSNTNTNYSGWLLKLDSNGCLVSGCGSVGIVEYEVFSTLTFKAFPNPAQEQIKINGELQDGDVLTLYDFTGKILQQQVLNGYDVPEMNVSEYANGIYLLSLYRSGYDKVTQKVVIAR